MSNFKIANFCEAHNAEFKIYYKYLENPYIYQLILKYYPLLQTAKAKDSIKKLIDKNYDVIIDRLKKIDIIISFYKENQLINKSEIGKFFHFYEKEMKKIDIKKKSDINKLFYKLISYENCLQTIKEAFYIFSDYRACIYFLTPSINFYNSKKTSKTIVKRVINNFKDNINTLNQIMTKIYLGDASPFGQPQYTTAYTMFETLIIIKKYCKNPLDELDIKFKTNKKPIENKELLRKLHDNFNKYKLTEKNINKINNVSHFIVELKRLGYDLWYTISLIFDTIYEDYQLNGIPEALVVGYKNIYLQKQNNILGVKCYILVDNDFITNVNIFNNFN